MAISNLQICPNCGERLSASKNPALTVDVIIETVSEDVDSIILIKRKNPPYGWAIPGGFVDYGESVEHAAIREAKEETNLDITLIKLLGVYSDPQRDPRGHTVSVVYIVKGRGQAKADDDAVELGYYTQKNLPDDLVFDHKRIISDYFRIRNIA